MLNTIKNDKNPAQRIEYILKKLHINGPIDNLIIEQLSYYKLFH